MKNNIKIEEWLNRSWIIFQEIFQLFLLFLITQNDLSILLKNLLSENYILIIQFIISKFGE